MADVHDKSEHNKHDKAYRALFETKDEFIYFLQKYIAKPWTEKINNDDLDQVDTSFVTDEFTDIDSDIIYKLKLEDGKEIYFYVLLELQSEVNFSMPFRLLEYMSALLRRVFYNAPENDRTRKGFRLPAVIPVIYYNGSDRWSAVRSFKEYTENYKEYSRNIIDFEYLICDLNRMDDEDILPDEFKGIISKAADCIFMLDKHRGSAEEFEGKLRKFQGRLSDDKADIVAKYVVYGKGNEVFDTDINDLKAFLKGEVETMTHPVGRMIDNAKHEGRLAGLSEGRLAGLSEADLVYAAKMAKEGFPFEVIKKMTGLPDDKIRHLISQV